ncbi:uncharacterized protein LOC134252638 [Saccostrea cucullata]|uniref:uncharacterized protein LOC134252638 n=1 Tax=Saccostrea cuccullata TaxID=36930 RepID=UPI002ED0A18D
MATASPNSLMNKKRANFVRISGIVRLYARILQDILYVEQPNPKMLKNTILSSAELRERLYKKENEDIIDSFSSLGNYEKCDITLSYSIIRNVCIQIKPTQKWGIKMLPPDLDMTVGDDIERIRITRNSVFAHNISMEIRKQNYKEFLKIAKGICSRLKRFSQGRDYVEELREIEESRVDNVQVQELKKSLEARMDVVKKDIKDIKARLQPANHCEEKRHLMCDVVKNILERYTGRTPVRIQAVETDFKHFFRYEKEHIETFKSITGTTFLGFLKNNQERFHIQLDNTQWLCSLVQTSSGENILGQKKVDNIPQISQTDAVNVNLTDVTPKAPFPVYSKQHRKTKSRFSSKNLKLAPDYCDDNNSLEEGTTKSDLNSKLYMRVKESSPDARFKEPATISKQKPSTNLNNSQHNSQSISKKVESFFASVNYFKKGAFVLVVGKVTVMKEIETLAFIPWLCVYDFDTSSRKDGLMSILENQLHGVYPCTWNDEPRFSHYVTQWCLIRGSVREPDTCVNGKVNDWSKMISKKLENNLKNLDQYVKDQTFIKVVVLWPELPEDAYFIQRLLSKMHEIMDPSPEVYVLDLNEKQDISAEESFLLKQIDPTLTLRSSRSELFHAICLHVSGVQNQKSNSYILPTFDGSNDPGIDENTSNYMKEFLDILYIEDVSGLTYEPHDLQTEGEEFLRGGTLKWSVYYACGDPGLFDVKRDQMASIIRHIDEKFIKHATSGIIEIYHSPGSGATTLGRRIIWELRTKIPCVQLKSSALLKHFDIAENLKVLSEKTQMPILILLEGVEAEVLYLYKLLKMQSVVPIFLYLRRAYQNVERKKNMIGQFHLREHVSIKEANQFIVRYQPFCDTDEKMENLQTMFENVKTGHRHNVFEFGLSTFLHEFKGIDSYVKGYLNFESCASTTDKKMNLNPMQRMLGYLALIYYYGHTSVPCLIFSNVLKKPSNFILEFEDLPYEVQKLAVVDTQHQHKQHIRICHQLMAKEILEQILTRKFLPRYSFRNKQLSETACRELKKFGLEFISEMASKQCSNYDKRSIIIDTFIKIFIQRSDLDANDCDNFMKKKPKFSRIITDIERYSSPSEGIEILQKLTQLFPDNASFHAHLGRKHSICFPDDEDVAEACFKKALDICKYDNGRIIKEDNMDENATLRMVHHMYGMHFFKRICRRTKNSQEFPFVEIINMILEYAYKACSHFEISREYSHIGHEELYGLSGEIGVRIEVCNYIKTHCGKESLNVRSRKTEIDDKIRFIRESMTYVLDLITHSYSVVEEADFPNDMVNNIRTYRDLFQGNVAEMICTTGVAVDHDERRRRVTAIKRKYDVFDILSLNKKADTTDVRSIVRLLEENFRDVGHKGLLAKGLFESDYKDWINAIRLTQNDIPYSLNSVMNTVKDWCTHLNTPTSKFYLFILHMLKLMSDQHPHDLYAARELREELRKFTKHYSNPRSPREYLGRGKDIKCLIPARFMKRIPETNFKEVTICKGVAMTPRLLKGTIKGQNTKPQTGFIALEVCNDLNQLDIFFVPIRTREKLVGKSYEGRRVEFILSFNINDGYEAFNVKLLQSLACPECKRSIEFTSDDNKMKCQCGKEIRKPE